MSPEHDAGNVIDPADGADIPAEALAALETPEASVVPSLIEAHTEGVTEFCAAVYAAAETAMKGNGVPLEIVVGCIEMIKADLVSKQLRTADMASAMEQLVGAQELAQAAMGAGPLTGEMDPKVELTGIPMSEDE